MLTRQRSCSHNPRVSREDAHKAVAAGADEEDAQQERSEEHHAEMKAVVKEEKDRKVEERVREEAPMVEAYQAQVALF